jgi:hypothetical protein
VIYGPGLTGLLLGGNDPCYRERWVTGRNLAVALSDVDLPKLLRSYVAEVGAHSVGPGGGHALSKPLSADVLRSTNAGLQGDRTEAPRSRTPVR